MISSPKVLSSKDLAAKVPAVRILDAELAPTEEHEEVDPEMEKFQALLQDYLTSKHSYRISSFPVSQHNYSERESRRNHPRTQSEQES